VPIKSVYVYGLVRAEKDLEFGNIGPDHNGEQARVYTVRLGSIGAVVSDHWDTGRIRPLRKNVEPHHRVIREVMKSTTVLPMAFGHVSKSAEMVMKMLKRDRACIEEQLERVGGRVEMGLKVIWAVDNIFEYMVERSAELKSYRDEIFVQGRSPSQPELIELGRMFETQLNKQREDLAERIELLRENSAEIKFNPAKNEKVVMDLSILVERGALERFEGFVHEVAKLFPAQCVVDYNGPWAPFNFVELQTQAAAA